MVHHNLKSLVAASTLCAVLCITHLANATSLIWDASGTNAATPTDGGGNWDAQTAANWSNGTSDQAWVSGITAQFGSNNGPAGIVTIDDTTGTVSAGGLIFNAAGSGDYTIAGSVSDTLTLSSATITVASGVSPTISAPITGSAGLSLVGSGKLTLAGANTYTGSTVVDGGSTLAYTTDNTAVQVLTSGATPTASTGSTTPSTIDLTSANVTATGLLIQTNSSSNNSLVIGTGKTLTVNGAMTVGMADVYAENNASIVTKLVASGGGTLTVNGGDNSTGNFSACLPRSNTPAGTDPTATVDLSGLNSFTYATSSTGEFRVGQGGNDSATVKLANNNTTSPSSNLIQTAALRIGDTASPNPGNNTGNNGAASTLTLGSTANNTIDANQITIGNGKSGGTLNFSASTGGGTITIANQAGTGNANITLGNASSASNSAGTCVMDFTGHTATVAAGTVILGRLAGSTGGTSAAGQITMDNGTFNVATSLQLGAQSSTSNSTVGAIGTFNLNGGTLNVSGAFDLVNCTVSASSSPITGTLNVNGGTVNSNVNIQRVDGTSATGTRTATINLSGGILDLHSNNIGTATSTISLTATKGTLQNLKELNGGGTLTKGGLATDTLILGGTNAYTGGTNINAGTLQVDGSYTAAGLFTVASGATVSGVGSIASAVSVLGGGNLSPGDNNINTLSVGSATLAGALNIDVNDANTPVVDLLNDSGSLDISAATSAVSFNVTGTLSGTAYVFAKYSSLTGTAFGTVSNLPSGYNIDYNYQGNNDIALVAVPEPSAVVLAAMAGLGLLFVRRRR